MEVYRVEHVGSGDGPFVGLGDSYQLFCNEIGYHNELEYPNLAADGLNRVTTVEAVTGMLERKLVDHWFPSWSDFRKYLKDNGYKVSTYDVHPDDVRHGKSHRQLMFSRNKAVKLNEEEL